jgi:hypothetical protein
LPDDDNAGQMISCTQLRRAVEGLARILGRSTVDLLVMDFERQGISLEKGRYDTKQVKDALLRVFGPEGGKLVAAKVQSILQSDINNP